MGTNSSVCEGGTVSSVTEPLPIAAEMLARWERSQQACNRVTGDMMSDGDQDRDGDDVGDGKGDDGGGSDNRELQM